MPKLADDLTAIGAPPTITTPDVTPAPAPAQPRRAAPARRPAPKPKALTWEERHVHKKIWFDREQLAKVQERLATEGEGQSVASLVKELFDSWLAGTP